MATQTCPSCGNPIALDARFCDKCGKPVSQPAETFVPQPAAAVVPTRTDPVKPWWLTFGILLFISLFIPLGLQDGKLMMFWNMFNIDANYSAWLIVNAVLGIGIFVITLIFPRGIVRGCVMGGVGLVSYLLYVLLAKTPFISTPVILFLFGQLCLGLVLGSVILRQKKPDSLTARLTGAISGGAAAVLFVIGVIILLIRMEPKLADKNWISIITNILGGLFSVMPIVAGIIALAIIGHPKNLAKLLKAIIVLTWVYLGGWVLWWLLQVILPCIAFGIPIEQTLMGMLPIITSLFCWLIYLVSVGLGFTEVLG